MSSRPRRYPPLPGSKQRIGDVYSEPIDDSTNPLPVNTPGHKGDCQKKKGRPQVRGPFRAGQLRLATRDLNQRITRRLARFRQVVCAHLPV